MKKHGITPKTIKKDVHDVIKATIAAEEQEEYTIADKYGKMSKKEREKVIAKLEQEMKEAAKALRF